MLLSRSIHILGTSICVDLPGKIPYPVREMKYYDLARTIGSGVFKYWHIVRGLNLQKHPDCSHRSTSTNFGPGLDMTIIYQFLEGAKTGSLCGSHFGQIQDGRLPE